jgi:hypothetical protein
MQYTIELLELWWACLTAAMKDRSLAFPISLVIGFIIGALFWWLAVQSAKLWNRRFHMKVSLQVLCGITALFAVIFTVTFASSKNLEDAIKLRLQAWKEKALADPEWQHESFCDAWDAVAKLGHEADVRLSPSPRTDKSLNIISMGHAESRAAVSRTFATNALRRFETDHPYMASILATATEVPKDRIDISMLSWFKDNPGQPYPLEEGVNVAVGMLQDGAKGQVEEVASYTRRMSIALFIISQVLLFGVIAFFAHRANRPASISRA